MRILQTHEFDARSFDFYSLYGQNTNNPDDPLLLSGFGPGLRRPQFCPAAGMLFFLDNARHLWKYDGQYYWEIGTEADSTWEAWRPTETLFIGGAERIAPAGKSVIEGYANMLTSHAVPIKPVWNAVDERYEVDVEDFTAGAGAWVTIPQYPETVVWILGFPFRCYETVYDPIAETWKLYMTTLDTEYLKYFHHQWDAFDACWNAHETANLNARVVFAWDLDDHWEHGLFDNWQQSADEEFYPGKLKGSYQWVFTLVSKDGHESNPCLEVTLETDDQIARIDIGRVVVPIVGDDEEDWPAYNDEQIREIRVYRTYADKPGAYYYHSSITYGKVPWWQIMTPSEYDLAWYFFDNTPDEQLGEMLHSGKLYPREGDCITSTKNCLIVSDGTGVYVSEVGDPETFYTYLSFEGAVLGLAAIPFFDEFLVFLHNRIYAVNIFDYSQRLVCHGIGLAGRDAIAVTNDRIMFQAHGGQIYQYTGSGVTLIPGYERIADLMNNRTDKRQVNAAQYSETLMAYSQRRNQVWCLLGEDGRHGNLVLVIQPGGAFLLYRFHPSVQVTCCHMFQQGGQEAVFLGLSDGTIVSFNQGAHSDNGLPIPILIESGEIGLVDEQVRVRRIYTEVIAAAPIQITITGRYDSRGAYVSEGVVSHLSCRDGDERHVNLRADVIKAYQFKLEEESINGFTLKSFSLIYQPKTERVRNWR